MEHSGLDGFFSHDPAVVAGAVAALAGDVGDDGQRSRGAVTSIETLRAVRGDDRLRAARQGLFSEVIFGPAVDDRCACGATAGAASRGVTCARCGVLCDRASLRDERWGHVEVTPLVHPVVFPHLLDALGLFARDLSEVAAGKKALRPVKVKRRRDPDLGIVGPAIRWELVPAEPLSEGDCSGPEGLAEALKKADPEHPLLPLCAITRVPVPPPGARPFATKVAPTQVDPWIGALNEAWVGLVERALRARRLVELEAPPLITRNESALLQQAFEDVVGRTRRGGARLVPPLVRVPDRLGEDETLAMAFVGKDRLIVQRRERVTILDLRGRVVFSLPPAGTALRGVTGGRFAVLEGFFGATHPSLAQDDPGFGPDIVADDGEGGRWIARLFGEVSVIDCETGTYLERPPSGASWRLVTNDQPEDLFLASEDGTPQRRLRVGGDRPGVVAYVAGMEMAWVGEEGDSTEVVELERGIPHALPCEPDDDEDTPRWDVLSGKSGSAGTEAGGEVDGEEEEQEGDEEEDEPSATAVAYRDGAWHLLWSNGILCDHRARNAVRLRPRAEAAAFDPTGRTLALLVRGSVVLLDVVRRKVIRRFALPAT